MNLLNMVVAWVTGRMESNNLRNGKTALLSGISILELRRVVFGLRVRTCGEARQLARAKGVMGQWKELVRWRKNGTLIPTLVEQFLLIENEDAILDYLDFLHDAALVLNSERDAVSLHKAMASSAGEALEPGQTPEKVLS